MKRGLRGVVTRIVEAGPIGQTALPEPKIIRAVSQLQKQINAGDVDLGEDVQVFLGRCLREYSSVKPNARIHSRDLRGMARFLFERHVATQQTLAKQSAPVALVLQKLAERHTPSLQKALLFAVLTHFQSDKKRLVPIVRALSNVPPERRVPNLSVALDHGYLVADMGVKAFLERIETGGASPLQLLEEIGLSGGLESSGFGEACFEAFCRQAAGTAFQLARHEVLMSWGLDTGQAGEKQERYATCRAVFLEALLLPHIKRSGIMPAKAKSDLRQMLVETFGDPRFSKSAPTWSGVHADAKQVLIQWLNEASLNQFFDVVTDVMTTSDEQRMWRYRRKLWTAYLPHIENAWVVMAPECDRAARRLALRQDDQSLTQFGKFDRGTVQSRHAVLLLTIGDLTIAEWNFNGTCRIWTREDNGAPKLYQRTYNANALRQNDIISIPHHGNENYSWQYKVESAIRRYTGLQISARDYRV